MMYDLTFVLLNHPLQYMYIMSCFALCFSSTTTNWKGYHVMLEGVLYCKGIYFCVGFIVCSVCLVSISYLFLVVLY